MTRQASPVDGGPAPEKLHIGGVDPEQERCLRCGSMFLDTGWECNDCGYDNLPHYANPPSESHRATQPGETEA